MLEILKGDQTVAIVHPGQRFHVPDEQLVVFNVQLDTEIPGHTIREYVPPVPEPVEPSTDPRDYPLRRWQFKAMVAYLGIHEAIEQAIASAFADDVLEREKVLARYRESDTYNRADPLFEMLAPAVGLAVEDLDAAWMQIATA